MPNNVSSYISYFRNLAVKHKDIQHDPQTEQGLGDLNNKRFTIFGNNELVQGLGSRTLGPTALCLELYDNSLSAENIYDIRMNPKGALMVINLAQENNFVDEERAYALTEGIMYELLQKIWADHHGPDAEECTRPFKSFKFTSDITPTGKLFTSYYGWYIQFSFDFKNTINISQPPADGTFLP